MRLLGGLHAVFQSVRWKLICYIYFDEVVTGIDKLMEERAAISLSPELESVEHKLADVKRTLAERADKAKRAEQQKNDLVVYLAHDIKTPLTSVIGR